MATRGKAITPEISETVDAALDARIDEQLAKAGVDQGKREQLAKLYRAKEWLRTQGTSSRSASSASAPSGARQERPATRAARSAPASPQA